MYFCKCQKYASYIYIFLTDIFRHSEDCWHLSVHKLKLKD